MYTHDDRDSAKFPERIFAAVIAGLCGLLFGWVVSIVVVRITGGGAWLAWVPAVGLGIFGFLAPSRSRDMLTEFWNEILGYFLKGR
jgi:hypothetical protein